MGAVWLQTIVKEYERKFPRDFIILLNGVIKEKNLIENVSVSLGVNADKGVTCNILELTKTCRKVLWIDMGFSAVLIWQRTNQTIAAVRTVLTQLISYL